MGAIADGCRPPFDIEIKVLIMTLLNLPVIANLT